MLLSTEIYRTPMKVTRAEFVPQNVLEVRDKETHCSGTEWMVLLPSVSISFGFRVAPRMSLGFRKTKVEYVNGYCHSLGVCLMWLDLA